MNKIIFAIALIFGLMTFQGCSDFFETNPDDILIGDDYIANINEFYSGYMGVAAKVADVADQAVILSELRSDLLEPTENAPQGLWEIYNYTNDNNNEFTNPSGFYDAIINANDYISKAIKFKYENPTAVNDDVFNGIMSATIRYQIWTYLMLGKLYGKAIYFNDPMEKYNPNHNYPTLNLDQLVSELLDLMTNGISISKNDTLTYSINGMIPFNFSELISVDGTPDPTWDLINPNPQCLKIELDLWAGNYNSVIAEAIDFLYADGDPQVYKVTFNEHDEKWTGQIFSSIHSYLVAKVRINAFVYNYENGQVNDLLKYFSNQQPNYYYLRPTQAAMNRFNNQLQRDGLTWGDKWRGENRSFVDVNGEWVYRKLTNYWEASKDLVYKTVDNIYMYRDADIHFFLMEALNQKHLFIETEALLNGGMGDDYYSKLDTSQYRYPFNNIFIQTAFTTLSGRYPNAGIRNRVKLANIYPSADSILEADKYCYQLDSLLLEETCMESNGEGRSLFAMIRHAKRWNNPSILATRISAKYPAGKREEVYDKLMANEDHWFIEFDIKNNPPVLTPIE
ncbi:MAG: hypothetical protein JW717_00340 [Marinilabiliaceae bacterium]|nr:hypothetical protein [Marinilabiliaceae bacterium]